MSCWFNRSRTLTATSPRIARDSHGAERSGLALLEVLENVPRLERGEWLREHGLECFSRASWLWRAWHRAATGGEGPGRDRRRWSDYGHAAVWDWARATEQARRSGQFPLRPTRPVDIAKSAGGDRRLLLQNVDARAEHRALLDGLRPLVDPEFAYTSFGGRPKRSRLDALAWIERRLIEHPGTYLATADIQSAFQSVKIARLREQLLEKVMCPKLVEWILTLARRTENRGLIEGGGLSTFLLNFHLEQLLYFRSPRSSLGEHVPDDQVPRSPFGENGVGRYIDDFLLAGLSADTVDERLSAIEKKLRSVGMKLNAKKTRAPRPATQLLDWLGYSFQFLDGELRVEVSEAAWATLRKRLVDCHGRSDGPWRARDLVIDCIAGCGPSLQQTGREALQNRLRSLASDVGFRELNVAIDFDSELAKASNQWEKTRARVDVDWQADRNRQARTDKEMAALFPDSFSPAPDSADAASLVAADAEEAPF